MAVDWQLEGIRGNREQEYYERRRLGRQRENRRTGRHCAFDAAAVPISRCVGVRRVRVLLSIFAIYMIFVSSGITDGVRKFLAEDRAVANWSVHVVGFYFRLAILLAGLGRSCWYSRPSSGSSASPSAPS